MSGDAVFRLSEDVRPNQERAKEMSREPGTSIMLTKADASLRHIEAALAAFDEGRFDVAITLAGAAEGMAPETPAPTLFRFLRDSPRIAAAGVKESEWTDVLNVERNWLKHAGSNYSPTMEFDRSAAAIMLVRAISKAHAAFGFQSGAVETFRLWVIEHTEDLFGSDAQT